MRKGLLILFVNVKVVKVFLFIFVICSLNQYCLSDDGIIPVKKGESIVVPFDGRFVRQDIYENMVKCGLKLEGEKQKCKLDIEKQEKICDEKVRYERDVCDVRVKELKDINDMLLKQFEKKNKWYENEFVRFVLTGVIVVGIVWGVSYAHK